MDNTSPIITISNGTIAVDSTKGGKNAFISQLLCLPTSFVNHYTCTRIDRQPIHSTTCGLVDTGRCRPPERKILPGVTRPPGHQKPPTAQPGMA
eukprot:TRINITY_DN119897_c0_g1_i1.p1 TRINITY_DN119897_c0_g1~~TRINITY_DN119897_c0_g1_i1.p1  ORF type:complete len:110 (-),score=2.77 TRINITY_DN119897_c0_g1_i1:30-311(-)